MTNDFGTLSDYASSANDLQGNLGGGGISLPDSTAILFWSNPDPKMRDSAVLNKGGLCISQEAMANLVDNGISHPGAGFVEHTRITDDEKEIPEFGTEAIWIAPLKLVEFWVESGDDRGFNKYFTKYADGRRSETYLFGLFGIETSKGIAPWTFGAVKVKGFQSKSLKDAIGAATKDTRDVRGKQKGMGKAAGFELPLSWFYVKCGRLSNKTQTVGKEPTTKKIGVIEINADVENIQKHFIGKEMLDTLQPYLDDLQEWIDRRLSFGLNQSTAESETSEDFDFDDSGEEQHPF